jgi:pyruvate,water dikinase
MSDDELQELRAIGRKCEKHYGKAQDIEWAVERGIGKILLLQSRPETVWSVKDAEAASVAPVVDNPLTHVMNIFGGRR